MTHLLAFADASVQDTGHERPLGCQRWLGNQAGQENQRGGEAGLLAGYTNLLADGLTGRFVLSLLPKVFGASREDDRGGQARAQNRTRRTWHVRVWEISHQACRTQGGLDSTRHDTNDCIDFVSQVSFSSRARARGVGKVKKKNMVLPCAVRYVAVCDAASRSHGLTIASPERLQRAGSRM